MFGGKNFQKFPTFRNTKVIEVKVDAREIHVQGVGNPSPTVEQIRAHALREAMKLHQFVLGVTRTKTGGSRKPWKYIFSIIVEN